MTLVLVEGFDHYNAQNGGTDLAAKGWSAEAFASVQGRGYVAGRQAIKVLPNHNVFKLLPSTYTTLTLGAAFQITGYEAFEFVRIEDNVGTLIASMGVSGAGHPLLTDSAARTVEGTSVLPTNSWFYLEIKVTKGTTGAYEVRLNGSLSAEMSGTSNFGTTNIGRVDFTSHGLGAFTLIDDVYACDTSGTTNNDFLGDIVVLTLWPDADGTYTQWTPDTGSDRFSRVDEHIWDGDASYIFDSTSGHKDSFSMDASPLAPITLGVQVNVGARKGDSGLRQIKPLVRQSATDYLGPTSTLTLEYFFYSWLLDQDPSGSDWSTATLNADEFGVETV